MRTIKYTACLFMLVATAATSHSSVDAYQKNSAAAQPPAPFVAQARYPAHGVPVRARGRYFFVESTGTPNRTVLFVKDGARGAPEPLVDPAAAPGGAAASIALFQPSPNANLVAYSLATPGSSWQEIRVRDVRRMTDLSDTLRWVHTTNIAWTQDNRGFLYSRYDAPTDTARREATPSGSHKLYFHTLGTSQSDDILVYTRSGAPDLLISAETTHDGEYAIITVGRRADGYTQIHAIDLARRGAARIASPVFRIVDDFFATFRFIRSDGPTLIFYTNHSAPKGRILAVDVNSPREAGWVTMIRESEYAIEGAVAAYDHFVVKYSLPTGSRLALFTVRGRPLSDLPLPERGTVEAFTGHPDHDEVHYSFTPLGASAGETATILMYNLENMRGSVYRQGGR